MKLTFATACVLLAMLAWQSSAFAIDLAPGDILVSDTNLDALFHIDPETGDRTVVSSTDVGTGKSFRFPLDMVFPGDGSILISDLNLEGIVRVDPSTGNRVKASGKGVGKGRYIPGPRAVEMDRDGALILFDTIIDSLVRVDVSTGDRRIISAGGAGAGAGMRHVLGLALLPDGDLLAADSTEQTIFRVDLATGTHTIVSSNEVGTGPRFVEPFDIVIASDGSALVLNFVPPLLRRKERAGVLRVDLENGNRTLFSGTGAGTGNDLRIPAGLALEADGSILVIDPGADILYRLGPVSGDRVVVSSAEVGTGPMFKTPRRVAVVPTPPGDVSDNRLIWISSVAGAAIMVLAVLRIRRTNKT